MKICWMNPVRSQRNPTLSPLSYRTNKTCTCSNLIWQGVGYIIAPPPPPPKMFFTIVLKHFGVGSWNFESINLWNNRKTAYFWSPGAFHVTIATSVLKCTRDFVKSTSICFLIAKFFISYLKQTGLFADWYGRGKAGSALPPPTLL